MSAVETTLSLASLVRVRPNSTRSVNLERDLSRDALAGEYVFTAQARRWLERIIDQVYAASPVRAWTLTGPYGSGKSLFGLFLMNLTAATATGHEQASQQLAQTDSILAGKVRAVSGVATTRGWLPAPVTGYRAPLQECIQRGLRQALSAQHNAPGLRPFLKDKEMWAPHIDSRKFVAKIEVLLQTLVTPALNFSGMALIVDELGKPLEFAGAHRNQADIYLLQELAELANRSGAAPLVFIGILHQGFERYAGQLDTATQREWAKVQGRFEDIAFQEPPTQQMWLLANALETVTETPLPVQFPEIGAIAAQAVEYSWCPPLMKSAEFERLCQLAFPFHPTALVAIPHLFRRLAQNERSLFAFLTSLEPRSFQEFLMRNHAPTMLRLPDLFDYLMANYHGRLHASMRARTLTEALERLDGTPEMSSEAIAIVKTVALLNWLADGGAVAATESNILFALCGGEFTDQQLHTGLLWLRSQSLLVFRRFNGTYAVWQGSDVDIEAQIEMAQQRLAGIFSLAEVVQAHLPPQPVVARRHSDKTGTVRYFELRYVDALNREQVSLTHSAGSSGVVLLCLAANDNEAKMFVEWAQQAAVAKLRTVVVGVVARTARLSELLYELRCLHWVKEHTAELRDDLVARREIRIRLGALQTAVQNELDTTLRLHRLTEAKGCSWFWHGHPMDSVAVRSLSYLLSEVSDQLYDASPNIRNELINRRQLSSQAAAARRNLIEAMLTRASQERLGIEGFPPERSMYESVLKASGLHRQTTSGAWGFGPPLDADPLHLRPAWEQLCISIFTMPPTVVAVSDLFAQLGAAPFGITDGVAPVLLCVFMLTYQDEMTLYREGTLLPDPAIADWEVLLRRPELFAVAGCRIVGPRLAVLQRLADGLQTQSAAMAVVRELIRRLKTLPEHAWRTQRLAPETLAARRAIEMARLPESLLFYELPTALGMPAFVEDDNANSTHIATFFERLNAALQELATATPQMIMAARNQLLLACGLPASDEGWQHFLELAKEMAPYVTQPSLSPLLRRAQEAQAPKMALESTLAYVANRAPRLWTDGDIERFTAQAGALGELFRAERNGHAPDAELTATQREQSRRLAGELRRSLPAPTEADPHVLRAALRTLLRELDAPVTP